jgi:hypothetical protein
LGKRLLAGAGRRDKSEGVEEFDLFVNDFFDAFEFFGMEGRT